MATSHVTRWEMKQWFHSQSSLILLTIVCISLLSHSHVGASSSREVLSEHVPTLKKIYGGVPKNSFPVVHRHARMPQSSAGSSVEVNSHRAHHSESLDRRGLRGTPHALTVPETDINISGGEYYAQLQIGTPPQTLLLVIDTGSQAVWAQSKQCIECFSEVLPRYDPTVSSTFETELFANGSHVPFSLSYGDGGANVGYLAKETLTIDSGNGNRVVIPGFEFGLSVNNTGYNDVYSGIMGLMRTVDGPSPFLVQLETLGNGTFSKFSTKFRYCFPDRTAQYSTTSFLSFGDIDEADTNSLYSATRALHKSKTLWTPILPNSPNSFYAVNLTAISVAGIRIPINPQELTLESVEYNKTMTILDSGTSELVLREPYFSLFVEAYYNATRNLAPGNLSTFLQDLTYNISTDVFDGYLFPSVSFIMEKWQKTPEGDRQEEIELFLPKNNVLGPADPDPGYTLIVEQAPDNITNIIGNFAQQSVLIEYDLEKSRVGFLSASCTFD